MDTKTQYLKTYLIPKAFFLFCIILVSCNKDKDAEETPTNYDWIPVGYQLPGDFDELSMPMNIYFMNGQIGFLGHQGPGDSFSFVRTDDSCSSFNDISGEIDSYASAICFPDNQTGYLSTRLHSLYKTENQGKTWDKIENDQLGEVLQIGSNSPDNIFVLSLNPTAFLQSTDGGETWTENEMPDGHNWMYSSSFQFLKSNPSIGFFNRYETYYRTIDGGDTWEEYFEFNHGNNGTHQISFLDSSIGYIFCDVGVFKTIDGGINFQKLDSFYARYLQIVSENEIYFAENFVIKKTFDDFKNISIMEVKTPTSNKYDKYMRGISFYAPKKGYAISGNGVFYRTAN